MLLKIKKYDLFLILVPFFALSGCKEVPVPKPSGYFRIDFPDKKYTDFDNNSAHISGMPFTFEYPVYGNLTFDGGNKDEQGWFNIDFPAFKAKIYLTYKEVDSDFDELMEQTYKMNVKNHIAKADAINEQVINNESDKVYSILYDLKGNTATAVQFYATDSVKNYLRGSLYFAVEPNADSLSPVIDFFREDVLHMIATLKWKGK